MHYIINPLQIKSTEERELLQALLKENLVYKTCKNEHAFLVQDHTVELTHRLVLKEEMVNDVPVFYVASPFAQFENLKTKIYPIECELSFPDKQFEAYRPTEKPLFIKVQWTRIHDRSQRKLFANNMHLEYKNSKLMSHLGAEKNVCMGYANQQNEEQSESVMVLNKMPGIELYALIEPFFKNTTPSMPSILRMRITLEILRAFEKQVYNQNLYHGDLKPENMVIDLGIGDNMLPPKFKNQHIKNTVINIIDPAGAAQYGSLIQNFSGTAIYCAPEVADTRVINNKLIISCKVNTVIDEKPDLYSIGKIIGLLWHWNYKKTIPADDNQLKTCVINLHQTFFSTEPSWFTLACLHDILSLVRGTTKLNPAERLSFDETKNFANEIARTHFSGEDYDLLYAEPESPMALHRTTSTAELSMYQEAQGAKLMPSLHITPDTVTASQSPLQQNGVFSPRPIMSDTSHVGASVFKPS